jgi:hypothetical protein
MPMKYLSRDKLNVRYLPGTGGDYRLIPRCYTLTHSDSSGKLYLTIGRNYDKAQISGWYTRLMRDEVLGEWRDTKGEHSLCMHCHVSGGVIFGSARMRYSIFRRELPLVLEAIRWGDKALFDTHPDLDYAPIFVYFHSTKQEYDLQERWGTPADYR